MGLLVGSQPGEFFEGVDIEWFLEYFEGVWGEGVV
jgi:hypothetical protein